MAADASCGAKRCGKADEWKAARPRAMRWPSAGDAVASANARHWVTSVDERSGDDDERASASDDVADEETGNATDDETDRDGAGKAASSTSRAIGGGDTPSAPITIAVSIRLTKRRWCRWLKSRSSCS
jgi:hypothetical protein